MRTIWKYAMPWSGTVSLHLPRGAQVLSVQEQEGALTLWALVDPKAANVRRTFVVAITGGEVGDRQITHLGTVQFGGYVAHIFEDTWKEGLEHA